MTSIPENECFRCRSFSIEKILVSKVSHNEGSLHTFDMYASHMFLNFSVKLLINILKC